MVNAISHTWEEDPLVSRYWSVDEAIPNHDTRLMKLPAEQSRRLRAYLPFLAGFLSGAFAIGVGSRLVNSEPYDLHVFRGTSYEVWVSTEAVNSWLPMSPYRYVVKERSLCKDSGNICSAWKTVLTLDVDDPTRASEWKLSETGNDLLLELPFGFQAERKNSQWSVRRRAP